MRQKFKNFFSALVSRYFLKHLAYALATVFVLVFFAKIILNSYTHQNESYRVDVPNLVGLKVSQLNETLEPLGLTYAVTDTVFSDKGARGTVLLQVPGPTKVTKQKVKQGREIYITVISDQPKLITVPDLAKKSSRRLAEGVLKIIGLKSKVKYRPDECTDCVLEVLYKNKPLKKGAKVAKGETITLVLGQKSGEKVTVVDLMGLTIEEAEKRLSSSSLTMFISCPECKTKKDSASAVIVGQSPASGDVAAGSVITVTLSANPH